jgi:hypothetical protein
VKLWHWAVLAGVLVACAPRRKPPPSSAMPDPAAPPPTEPLYFFVHEASLVPLVLRAVKRIEQASGIKIHVNAHGTIATARPIFTSDFLCATGTDGRSTPHYIVLARDCKADPEKVLVHELIHQLGVGHLELPARGIMNKATDSPLDTISADDLEALCAVQPCTVFQPEA